MTANAGYHLFNTGDVLTAAQVQYNLQNQTIMYFASSAARTSALSAVLVEGMFSYLADTNSTEYYTGSAWVSLAGMTNPLTTTGDTIYSSSGTTPARLGIGTTGQVLTVASGIPSWATPAASASGLTLISSTSFTTSSGHSVNSCFSATYANYRIILKLSAVSGTNTEMLVRLRASGTDATTNYTTVRQLTYSAGVSSD
jgi:hypothetical protein